MQIAVNKVLADVTKIVSEDEPVEMEISQAAQNPASHDPGLAAGE